MIRVMVTEVKRDSHELMRMGSDQERDFIPGQVMAEVTVVFHDHTMAQLDEMIENRVVFDLIRADR